MKLLIKKARLILPGSSPSSEQTDLLIEDGIIAEMGTDLSASNAETITSPNLHVSIGWFDLHANFCDPGYEDQEDLQSGLMAAAHGGFTGVAIMPSTQPAIDNKAGVEYLRNRALHHAVELVPIGTVSRKQEGKELAEMYDMHQAGARAFSDDKRSISNPDLLKRALLYTKGFNSTVMQFPFEKRMADGGMMNEGPASTHLGMRGIPTLSEELAVTRDLYLLEYTGGRMHFQTISAKGSVELIAQAKGKDLQVTAEVSAHVLVENDEALAEFDTNLKVLPPLRGTADQSALLEGLKQGVIDVICSDHQPDIEENKKCEFEHASFGMASIETVYPLLNTRLGEELPAEMLVEKMAVNPRKILGLDIPVIAKGAQANLTLFDPDINWTFERKDQQSKAANSPYYGTEFKGKVIGIVREQQVVLQPVS